MLHLKNIFIFFQTILSFALSRNIIFKIILSIFKKKHGEKTDNPSIKISLNKIENRITFKTKTGYYLKLLTTEMMKLLDN